MTIHDEMCPSCDRTDSNYWVSGTPSTDTWACRCGYEWIIAVEPVPAEVAR